MATEFKTPGIVTVIDILAWLMIVGGPMTAALGTIAVSGGAAMMIGGLFAAFGGLILMALCVATQKLNFIEYHLTSKDNS